MIRFLLDFVKINTAVGTDYHLKILYWFIFLIKPLQYNRYGLWSIPIPRFSINLVALLHNIVNRVGWRCFITVVTEHLQQLKVLASSIDMLRDMFDFKAFVQDMPLKGLEQKHLASPEHAAPASVCPVVWVEQRLFEFRAIGDPSHSIEGPLQVFLYNFSHLLSFVVPQDKFLME